MKVSKLLKDKPNKQTQQYTNNHKNNLKKQQLVKEKRKYKKKRKVKMNRAGDSQDFVKVNVLKYQKQLN